ncbi:Gfo/Idh/MocA family oxidoreductase [Gemmata sp. JC673]|uniref:Gfo/Idh/MocA family oxidoreductase n=1 Tax=Gemmata algarum TaxID=2975278 RepID=A0ABU5EVP1_9BACT|nr:Gfo/Idh/MocA family oxidoreductase [Gemmata algarum]MDY3559220.1 Gfo/Idh/MocA family oxidoreductase [Gemmata algarum]
MSHVTRRDFTTAAAAAATALSAGRVRGANERIRVGFIGLGNRGDQVLSAFLEHKDCEVAAVCDIYQPYLDFAAQKIGTNPQQFRDYRKLLEKKDVDAVVIVTPDHWHALMCVEACAAGKDVYVEKPLSLYVSEGRAMVKAARDHKRVVQCGIQRLSSPVCREAAEVILSGGIGKVTAVRAFHVQNEWPKGIGSPPDGNPPDGFDWDQWVGPAPLKKYNKNRAFYRFRWFYDYSGGQLTNFGVHYLAQIQSALGADAPKAVVALGGKFADYDNREVPDTLEVLWHYPGDTLVTFSQFNATGAPPAARPCEIEFRGTKGTMYFRTNGYEIVPEVVTPNEFAARTPLDRSVEKGWRTGAKPQIEAKKVDGAVRDADHARNFLDCVTSRKAPNCDVERGHRCTTAALIANIAHRTKSYLEWDATAERFTNNEAANKMLHHEYRAPYKLG